MRRRSASLLALLLAILIIPLPSAAEEVEYTFDGGGWGHGVGMSQYGAYGMARAGSTSEEIVEHYFTGTEVQPHEAFGFAALADEYEILTTVDNPLWVNLLRDRVSFSFVAVNGPLDLCQAGDGTGDCPRIEHPLPGDVWTFKKSGAQCQFYREGIAAGPPGSCRASISLPGESRVEVEGVEYGRGEVKIRSQAVIDGFHVSLAVTLEEYLYGLGEVPSSWSTAALEAQVIAARTYAMDRFLRYEIPENRSVEGSEWTSTDAGLSNDSKSDCWCHIYDTPSHQNYVGWSKEAEVGSGGVPLGEYWQAAVDNTQRQVVSYFGPSHEAFTLEGLIQAFYFSSSAGWTNTNVDGFGSSVQYPYLLPVPDPGSQDPTVGNPYAAWESTKSAADLASSLGWDSVTSVDVVQALPGSTVRFTGLSGGVEVTADKKSWWLDNHFLSGQVTAVNGVGPPGPFADISSSPHAANIIIIWQEGVTQGCAPLLFCPNAPVTRGQMASFLARSLELPEPIVDFFEDDDGSTHEDNINRVAEAGIATGFADGTYRPQDPVRRDHMATFMARALGLEPVAGTVFTDVFGFHEGNINALAAAGVTEGCDEEGPRFCPAEFVTRGQMASFLARAFFIP